MPAKTDLSFRHLRERLTHLRTISGPIPLIIVECPTGANVDAESIAVASRDVLFGEPDAGPPMRVYDHTDDPRGRQVSVYFPRRPDAAWARFHGVAQDAHRVVSPHLVASGLLDAADAGTGSWIVAVARTLEGLGPDSPCPVELDGGAARRWNPVGRFFVDERSVLHPLTADATDHRYLVLRDAVEASIAVLDLLAGRLNAAPDGGEQLPPGGRGSRPRRGSGKPNGRPSKEADKELRKLIRLISQESRCQGLDVGRELQARVYERTADELSELLEQLLRVKIAASTLRSSSKLWKQWSRFRRPRGKPAGSGDTVALPVAGELHVGGARRTADERRQDAAVERWAAEAGVQLDGD